MTQRGRSRYSAISATSRLEPAAAESGEPLSAVESSLDLIAGRKGEGRAGGHVESVGLELRVDRSGGRARDDDVSSCRDVEEVDGVAADVDGDVAVDVGE